MKTLQQIQEDNRKFIIMAKSYEAKSYEEALEMELGFGCEVILFDELPSITMSHEVISRSWNRRYIELNGEYSSSYVTKIIGKPLTLNRVLYAFKSMELGYLNGFLFEIDINIDNRYDDEKKIICEWDLKKETLEEQSEETQRKINEIIN
jgi:hypothetical protein